MTKSNPGSHTATYNLIKVVYYQGFQTIREAIAEEKRLKNLSRKNKYLLITSMNPEWKDLTDDVIE